MECEVYVLESGEYQCGNCGCVMDYAPEKCEVCGAKVVNIIEEGESDYDYEW